MNFQEVFNKPLLKRLRPAKLKYSSAGLMVLAALALLLGACGEAANTPTGANVTSPALTTTGVITATVTTIATTALATTNAATTAAPVTTGVITPTSPAVATVTGTARGIILAASPTPAKTGTLATAATTAISSGSTSKTTAGSKTGGSVSSPPLGPTKQRLPFRKVVLSPDSKILAGSTYGYSPIELWDMSSEKLLGTLDGGNQEIADFAFSPDGALLVSSDGEAMRLWDVASRQQIGVLAGNSTQGSEVALSPDGRLLATSSSFYAGVEIWDLATRKLLLELSNSKQASNVVFGPDSKAVVANVQVNSSTDQSVFKLWNLNEGRELMTFRSKASQIPRLLFSRDGTTLTGVDLGDGAFYRWDVASGKTMATLPSVSKNGFVFGYVVAPNGNFIATLDNTYPNSRKAYVYDLASSNRLATIPLKSIRSPVSDNFDGGGLGLAFSPDGKILAVIGADNTIELWDMAAAKLRSSFKAV